MLESKYVAKEYREQVLEIVLSLMSKDVIDVTCRGRLIVVNDKGDSDN
jgi:hypothetical protein